MKIEEKKQIPDIAFCDDFRINRLLCFRNLNDYPFPVIGLIHSLGNHTTVLELSYYAVGMKEHDIFICPSKSTQDTVVKLGISKAQTVVLHYGLDIKKFKPSPSKNKLRETYNIPLNKTVLLCLSRISPQSKMDFMPLIKMVPELCKKDSNLHLLVVGAVDDEIYLKEMQAYIVQCGIQDVVQFITKPKQRYIEHYYQCADYFLSLSDACGETFGLTVIEAMACGLPVIISDIAGYKEHITDQIEGIYIPTVSAKIDYDHYFYYHNKLEYGDVYAQSIAVDNDRLKKAILSLLKDKSRRESMGMHARKIIENRNTLRHMCDAYLGLFQKQSRKRNKEIVNMKIDRFPSIWKLFSHFPTKHIKESDRFRLTEMTKLTLSSSSSLFVFETHLKRYNKIQDILYLIGQKQFSFNELKQICDGSEQEIVSSLLYLLKHDYVTFV